MIPKPQHLDALPSKKLDARTVMPLPGSIIISATIDFKGQLRGRTTEIDYVSTDWMLPSKFGISKIPIPQVTPKNALRFRRIFSKITGAVHELI